MPERNNARMISLRLTADEFEALQTRYREYGAESVSDFVRMSVAQLLGTFAPPSIEERLAEIREKVSQLDSKMELLSAVVGPPIPAPYQSATCSAANACGYCAQCNWERDKGLRA